MDIDRLKKALAMMKLDGIESVPVQVSREELRQIVEALEGRKRGKWIKKTKTIELNGAIVYDSVWICPNCGTEYDGGVASNLVNYCYRCGMDLRVEGKQE